MNTRYYMVIVKGEIKTSEIVSCEYNSNTHKWDVKFNNGKIYSYAYSNVEKLMEPNVLDSHMYVISRGDNKFFDIKALYVFKSLNESYWHICFENGSERDYRQSELIIIESCLKQNDSKNVFEYLKQIADLSDIKNEDTGEKLLTKRFNEISFVGENVALAQYMNPHKTNYNTSQSNSSLIFPFGCNNSQYKAVKNAIENQFSIIQGPPGTGKTQTILNIIANILIQGKTVQVVSNNNSAIENIYEKLSSAKYDLGFVVASLGNSENKKEFIHNQRETYPDFLNWKISEDCHDLQKRIVELSVQLKDVFDYQEKLATLRQEQSHLITEYEYFKQYIEASDNEIVKISYKKNVSSKKWMALWNSCQLIFDNKKKLGFWNKIKIFFEVGIYGKKFYMQDISGIINTFRKNYYDVRQKELSLEIANIEKYLNSIDKNLLKDLCNQSLNLLKGNLAERYGAKVRRKIFTEDDLWKESEIVLDEYPVILSTTFSSRNSLNRDVVYDYLIMDEASQIDIATGALALSSAKNVVIVGDTKQLPNVVTKDIDNRAKAIFERFNIHEGYQFSKSFLQSVLDVMPDIKQTLLREHYRCHPKIINFCNQKFYNGELIIMTEDKGEEDVLTVVKTIEGNHERNHYSQRQIDVIKNEILTKTIDGKKTIGIIAPYKNQIEKLKKEITDVDIATVHMFQGREKDNIIISTVDDEISDFTDNQYLINVAVSRAKERLIVVVSGNTQSKKGNIADLIDYIDYNNFEITESKIYSIFDYLYKQYTNERITFLKNRKKISEYESENLMYALIEEIIDDNKYSSLDVICHFPVNMLIRNPQLLNEQEYKYAMNPLTHIDFLIYNRISKKPVLAIEVDGYSYHMENSEQGERDVLKNHIMEVYEIPLLRFKTNGSGEKEKIINQLNLLMD